MNFCSAIATYRELEETRGGKLSETFTPRPDSINDYKANILISALWCFQDDSHVTPPAPGGWDNIVSLDFATGRVRSFVIPSEVRLDEDFTGCFYRAGCGYLHGDATEAIVSGVDAISAEWGGRGEYNDALQSAVDECCITVYLTA